MAWRSLSTRLLPELDLRFDERIVVGPKPIII
jgi:hypothetical protein